jgi:glutathione S-transferase
MLEVHHHPLCPFSRKLRIILNEKKIEFELFPEAFWLRRREFLKMNPSGETPVVVKTGNKILAGNYAINEYLEETADSLKLIFGSSEQRAEIRRVTEWFDIKFFNEVTRYILHEKIIKTLSRVGAPNSEAIRAAKQNILYHLDYIGYLCAEDRYLAGDQPSMADFAAAAQISVLDFVGDVPWSHNQKARDWYSLMKSRPSFKPILLDKVSHLNPPSHYQNPDF